MMTTEWGTPATGLWRFTTSTTKLHELWLVDFTYRLVSCSHVILTGESDVMLVGVKVLHIQM